MVVCKGEATVTWLMGISETYARGRALVDHLSSTGLMVVNAGVSPTSVNIRRREGLDVTVCSALTRFMITMDAEISHKFHRGCSFCDPNQLTRNRYGCFPNTRTGMNIGGNGEF